jgi:diguanylate cyclase (GGDEF)-like protein
MDQQSYEDLLSENQLLLAEVERLRIYKDYAYTDVLTEIPNRRFYYERVVQEVARAMRSGHALTVALVDLDHFKSVNDREGHRAGDQLLKFFAQFLRSSIRQEDTVCRFGGDEFALLLPDAAIHEAAGIVDRIREKLGRIQLSIDGRSTCDLTFSCGLASHRPGLIAEDLLEEADHSLFTAKARGRNRVIAAAPAGAEPTQTQAFLH